MPISSVFMLKRMNSFWGTILRGEREVLLLVETGLWILKICFTTMKSSIRMIRVLFTITRIKMMVIIASSFSIEDCSILILWRIRINIDSF